MNSTHDDGGNLALPIIINSSIVEAMIKYYSGKPKNDTSLALSLYVHLYYTARRQNNVQVWAKNSYLKTGLGIGDKVLKRIKSDLFKMRLIKYITKHGTDGRISAHYIKVNHIWGRDAIGRLVGKTDVRMVKMAKRYLLDTIDTFKVLCESDDVSLPEIMLNDVTVEVSSDIYFNEDGLIKLRGETHAGGEFDYTFTAEDAPLIIMQVYELITSTGAK